jgi:hypothetical protein
VEMLVEVRTNVPPHLNQKTEKKKKKICIKLYDM